MSGPARAPAGAASWRGYIALSLAWSILLAVVIFLDRRPSTEPIVIVPPPTAAIGGPIAAPAASAAAVAASPTPTPGPLVIDVAGAVRAPGVYRLPAGSIVVDAIAAAGGAADDADLDRLNKAIALEDRMQVYVPHRAAEGATGVTRAEPVVPVAPSRADDVGAVEAAPGPGEDRELIDINTATLAQLDTLPGVGETIAQDIIAGRPYGKIEDLLNVDGIGEARFAKLKDRITVR
jgi:competence protein ComEA